MDVAVEAVILAARVSRVRVTENSRGSTSTKQQKEKNKGVFTFHF